MYVHTKQSRCVDSRESLTASGPIRNSTIFSIITLHAILLCNFYILLFNSSLFGVLFTKQKLYRYSQLSAFERTSRPIGIRSSNQNLKNARRKQGQSRDPLSFPSACLSVKISIFRGQASLDIDRIWTRWLTRIRKP